MFHSTWLRLLFPTLLNQPALEELNNILDGVPSSFPANLLSLTLNNIYWQNNSNENAYKVLRVMSACERLQEIVLINGLPFVNRQLAFRSECFFWWTDI